MSEPIFKLQPNRTMQLRGFDAFGAAAAMHSATENAFTVSGVFRDAADFAVLDHDELTASEAKWLQTHFPDRAAHVLSLIRQTRAGALNDARFGHRFAGQGPYADLLAARFARAARKLGLEGSREGLDCTQFRPPQVSPTGFAEAQMQLAF